jgi:hypothetical protein
VNDNDAADRRRTLLISGLKGASRLEIAQRVVDDIEASGGDLATAQRLLAVIEGAFGQLLALRGADGERRMPLLDSSGSAAGLQAGVAPTFDRTQT